MKNEIVSNQKISEILKTMRQEQGFSQASLAESAGLSMKTIYQYERGAISISMASIIKIDQVMNGRFLRAIIES